MNETKSLLASKTFWGALVSGLALLLGVWGKQLSPEDQTQLVEIAATIAGVLGSLVAIVGRVTAKKTIAGPGNGVNASNAAALLLAAALALTSAGALNGCASQPASSYSGAQAAQNAPQVALDTGAKLAKGYFAVHNAYVALETKADPALAGTLKRVIAPALNKAKHAVVAYNDVALLWMQTGERPTDYDAMLAAAQTLLADAAAALKEIAR